MKSLALLLAALLLASPAAAARKKKDSRWKLTACLKACIPGHDAKVIACRVLGTKEADDCVKKADEERAACERTCRQPPKPAKK